MKNFINNIVPKKLRAIYRLRVNKPMPMNWTDEERERTLTERYKMMTGWNLNWNDLQLYQEKIQWYKLYYDYPDFSKICCKYNFKKYIEDKIGPGHTLQCYGVWKNVDEIDWEKLPDKFVLKSNCCSDGNGIMIIDGKNNYKFDSVKKEIKEWLNPMNTLVGSLCRCYYDVTPLVLAEEYVEHVGKMMTDYKFLFFNGELNSIDVCGNRKIGKSVEISEYDSEWHPYDWLFGDYKPFHIERPEKYPEMVEIAKELARPFPLVRVDFYEMGEKICLSEMTFYPGGGYNNKLPINISREWGDKFILPEKQLLGRKFRYDLV